MYWKGRGHRGGCRRGQAGSWGRLPKRLGAVTKAVGGGYCRLQMPLGLGRERLGIGWGPGGALRSILGWGLMVVVVAGSVVVIAAAAAGAAHLHRTAAHVVARECKGGWGCRGAGKRRGDAGFGHLKVSEPRRSRGGGGGVVGSKTRELSLSRGYDVPLHGFCLLSDQWTTHGHLRVSLL